MSATRAFIALLALSLTGCSLVPVADQTGELTKAAHAFRVEAAQPSQRPAADATLAKAVLLGELVSGVPTRLPAGCDAPAHQFRDAVIHAAPADQGAAYKSYKTLRTCGARPASAGGQDDDPGRQALSSLTDYLDGLQAILDADDQAALAAASKTLAASLGGLATAAKAPAPVVALPAFADKLADAALAQGQYDALRAAVLAVDPLLDRASPDLVRALRIAQSRQISDVADDAALAVAAMDAALNAPAVQGAPEVRLRVYDRLSPLLDEVVAQQTAARRDPARALHDLVDAHHKLAAALRSGQGQTEAILASVIDIVGGAHDLAAGATPNG